LTITGSVPAGMPPDSGLLRATRPWAH